MNRLKFLHKSQSVDAGVRRGQKADMNAPSVSGRNRTATIMDDLGKAIVTGEYPVGSALPYEAVLCETYGASRPIVREAVKMLTAKGLLEARQRRGTVILAESEWNLMDTDVLRWMLGRQFSLELLIDFAQMRLSIEPHAAALAARSATGEQRQAMSAAIARMKAAENGKDDPLDADIAFHVSVLEASNNRFLQQFTDLSSTALRFSIRVTNERKGVTKASAKEHKEVLDAILEGKPEVAAEKMYGLINSALQLLLKDAETQ